MYVYGMFMTNLKYCYITIVSQFEHPNMDSIYTDIKTHPRTSDAKVIMHTVKENIIYWTMLSAFTSGTNERSATAIIF